LGIEFVIFWVVVSCSMVVGYQHVIGLCYLHFQGSSAIMRTSDLTYLD